MCRCAAAGEGAGIENYKRVIEDLKIEPVSQSPYASVAEVRCGEDRTTDSD